MSLLPNAKVRLVVSMTFNKLADLLFSAKITLPALLMAAGAPHWIIGALVPVRESGALLPQALLGIALRRYASRHPMWRIGMLVQIFAVIFILLAVGLFQGVEAGVLVICAVAVFSLGRAACSITIKDIQADIAPKGQRGRLLGLASMAAGILTLLISVPLLTFRNSLPLNVAALCSAGALVAFILTLTVLWPQHTYVELDSSQKQGRSEAIKSARRLLARFILVRGLFVHSALVAPFFLLDSGLSVGKLLPVFVAGEAIASLLTSFIWGRLADNSARLTLQVAGLLCIVACLGFLWSGSNSVWMTGTWYLLLAIAHTGVRTGRQTYTLDIISGQHRTELVGFSNTAIGIILLAMGAVYAIVAPDIGFSVVAIMAFMLILAVASTTLLPQDKNKQANKKAGNAPA